MSEIIAFVCGIVVGIVLSVLVLMFLGYALKRQPSDAILDCIAGMTESEQWDLLRSIRAKAEGRS